MIRIYQKDGLNIGKVLNAKLFKEQRDEPQPMLKNVFKCQRLAFTAKICFLNLFSLHCAY